MCSNIPTKPTYGVYISQLIRISRICDKFDSFVKGNVAVYKDLNLARASRRAINRHVTCWSIMRDAYA